LKKLFLCQIPFVFGAITIRQMTIWQSKTFTNKYGNSLIQNLSQILQYLIAETKKLLREFKHDLKKNFLCKIPFVFGAIAAHQMTI
jgi:hypothetical protein